MGRLSAALGKPLMPWQQYVADVGLELDEAGQRFRYSRVVVSVPRQSGKTTLTFPVMLHRALTVADGSAWMTAQSRNDVRDTFMILSRVVARSVLGPRCRIRYANGSEGIELPGGGGVRLFAPGEGNLHGKTTDFVLVDEIWAFTKTQGADLMQAVVPTMLTRPRSQTWMVSTAGTSKSAFMRQIVSAARAAIAAGEDTDTAYFEWSIPDDADPLDLDTVLAHHPAWGHTVTSRRALAYDPAIMSAAEYARAYGNIWVSSDAYYIAPKIWERARSREPLASDSPVAFGVEVYPDRSGAIIVAAGRDRHGRLAVETVEFRAHFSWAAPRVIELVRRHRPVAVVVDPYGPARPVHAALSEQRGTFVPLIEPFSAADLVQADSEFVNGIIEGAYVHRSSGRLDSALSAATTRTVREQAVISRTGDEDTGYPAALIAAMLAAYGLVHPPDVPPRPEVVGARQNAHKG